MWIKFKKTYIGPAGLFEAGRTLDLPESILKQVPNDCYEETCAPWDEHKDNEAIKLAQAKGNARDARAWAEIVAGKAEKAQQRVDTLISVADKKNALACSVKKAADEALKKSKSKPASDKDKKHALGLARECEKKNLEYNKADAELLAAIAELGLRRLDTEDALAKADRFNTEAEKIEKEAVDKKAKTRAKAQAEAKAEAKKKAKEDDKAKTEAEAKAKDAAKRDAEAKAGLNARIDANRTDIFGKPVTIMEPKNEKGNNEQSAAETKDSQSPKGNENPEG